MRIRLAMTVAIAVTIAMGTAVNAAAPADMVLVPAGEQQSFFVTRGRRGRRRPRLTGACRSRCRRFSWTEHP
jgi:hypothetical protein